jgi:hypothetical protein
MVRLRGPPCFALTGGLRGLLAGAGGVQAVPSQVGRCVCGLARQLVAGEYLDCLAEAHLIRQQDAALLECAGLSVCVCVYVCVCVNAVCMIIVACA